MFNRAWNWLGYWADRLTPRTRWGAGAYKRYSGDHHLTTDSWTFGEHHLLASQEQHIQNLGMQLQQQGASRLSLDMPLGMSAGGAAGTPYAQQRSLRRQSQLASCQTSTEGVLGGTGLPSCAGTAPAGATGGANPLARLSQGSHLSHLSLLPEGRPEDQMQYLQQQIQWAMNKVRRLSTSVQAGHVTARLTQQQLHHRCVQPQLSAGLSPFLTCAHLCPGVCCAGCSSRKTSRRVCFTPRIVSGAWPRSSRCRQTSRRSWQQQSAWRPSAARRQSCCRPLGALAATCACRSAQYQPAACAVLL